MANEIGKSRIEAILENILGADNEILPPMSRNEELLIAILESGTLDPDKIKDAVDEWLDEHPEATTTVEDGSITMAKLAEDVTERMNNSAPVIITSASGSIANFPDGGEDLPVENLWVSIEPTQSGSGDPSPTNVRPITGWDGCEVVRCGKNLIDYTIPDTHDLNVSYSNGVYTTSDGDTASSLRLKLQQRGASYDNIADAQIVTPVMTSPTTIYITTIIREGAYTLRFSNNGASREFSKCFDISNLTPGMEVTFSVNLIDITIGAIKFKDCQLEFGSTASNYTPFQGSSTYPVSWVTTSGTVYGGRVNVTTGELVVTHGIVDLGTLNWTYVPAYMRFTAPGLRLYAKEKTVDGVCDLYTLSTLAYVDNNRENNQISVSSNGGGLLIRDFRYTDSVELKTAISGHYLVYKLATPLIYQLTPVQVRTLLGVNNVWADCGDTEVEYRADTKLYIERLTQPTEDDMIANVNIASGKYFLVGNALFLSTTAIATGETIKPGTNCTATNLAAALNALNA